MTVQSFKMAGKNDFSLMSTERSDYPYNARDSIQGENMRPKSEARL